VHLGHLGVLGAARREAGLARVILIPAAVPPHKPGGTLAGAAARLEMLRLATAGDPALEVSDIELRRAGPSFTIDTLRALAKGMTGAERLMLILGLDAFLEMDSWRAPRDIFRETGLVVVARSGLPATEPMMDRVDGFLRRHIDAGYRCDAQRRICVHALNPPVLICTQAPPDISATEIRRRVRCKLPIGHLVPPAVADYIHQKGLYR
jgi:nicotinate-nucleotide adenylyltransferase